MRLQSFGDASLFKQHLQPLEIALEVPLQYGGQHRVGRSQSASELCFHLLKYFGRSIPRRESVPHRALQWAGRKALLNPVRRSAIRYLYASLVLSTEDLHFLPDRRPHANRAVRG